MDNMEITKEVTATEKVETTIIVQQPEIPDLSLVDQASSEASPMSGTPKQNPSNNTSNVDDPCHTVQSEKPLSTPTNPIKGPLPDAPPNEGPKRDAHAPQPKPAGNNVSDSRQEEASRSAAPAPFKIRKRAPSNTGSSNAGGRQDSRQHESHGYEFSDRYRQSSSVQQNDHPRYFASSYQNQSTPGHTNTGGSYDTYGYAKPQHDAPQRVSSSVTNNNTDGPRRQSTDSYRPSDSRYDTPRPKFLTSGNSNVGSRRDSMDSYRSAPRPMSSVGSDVCDSRQDNYHGGGTKQDVSLTTPSIPASKNLSGTRPEVQSKAIHSSTSPQKPASFADTNPAVLRKGVVRDNLDLYGTNTSTASSSSAPTKPGEKVYMGSSSLQTTTPQKGVAPFRPHAPGYLSDKTPGSAIHRVWRQVGIHTTKCDRCDKNCLGIQQRCVECNKQFCRSCIENGVLDKSSNHDAPVGGWDWTEREKIANPRKRTVDSMAEGSSARRGSAKRRPFGVESGSEDEHEAAKEESMQARPIPITRPRESHVKKTEIFSARPADGPLTRMLNPRKHASARPLQQSPPEQNQHSDTRRPIAQESSNPPKFNQRVAPLSLGSIQTFGDAIALLDQTARIPADDGDRQHFAYLRSESWNNDPTLERVRNDEGEKKAQALFDSASLIMRIVLADQKSKND